MLYNTRKEGICIKLRITMILLMVVVLVCSVGVANHEREKWEAAITESSSIIEKNEGENKSEAENNVDVSIENNVDTSVENTIDYHNYDVPSNNTIKSYMDYRRITLTSSKQYKLQHSLAYTGEHGIRMVNERYCVAVGSYYTTTIGQYIDIELENGNVIHGILADCKDDKDTDSTNRLHSDGSVVEFVVDTKVLDDTAKIMGDISYVNGWDSKIINIKVYDKIEKF